MHDTHGHRPRACDHEGGQRLRIQATQGDCGSSSTEVAAGAFGEWLSQTHAALRGTGGTDVPCGDCVGCCVSSYYIPIRPADRRALELVPDRWLVRSGRSGQWLIGYRDDGTCPMQKNGGCSIYADRPQTCRDYDCRIFAAAGIEAGDDTKRVINQRVRAWRFTYATDAEQQSHAAIKRTAAFVRAEAASFTERVPTSPTGIAVFAVKAFTVFLEPDIDAKTPAEIAAALLVASRKFDAEATVASD